MAFLRQIVVSAGCSVVLLLSPARVAGGTTFTPSPIFWVASWAMALQSVPDLVTPPLLYRAPVVAGRTVRQIIYPTLSSGMIRIRVSNAYGKTPLVINEVKIAHSAGGARLRADSSKVVTFGGRHDVHIASGQDLESDPMAFEVVMGKPYAISLYMGPLQKMTVWHRIANQINYISMLGNHAGDLSAEAYHASFTQAAWISELTVVPVSRQAVAFAVIGDSITDGMGSTRNQNQRWPDGLSRRLIQAGVNSVAVLNLGISGNRLLSDSLCYGQALEKRFARDVLDRPGVRAVAILIGINDLNFAAMRPRAGLDCDFPHTQVSAQDLIAGYRRLIAAAHSRNVAIWGATLTPAGLPASREAVRQAVNDWIRRSGEFDEVIDFDLALRNPMHSQDLLRCYDSGDGIHPNDAGYAIIASVVPLKRLIELGINH